MSKVVRLKVLGGITVRKTTGCGNMYIQLNWYHGRLFEVFATLGHSGGCSMSHTEALTRSITTGLRQEIPVPVEDYIDQLHDIRCLNPYPFPVEEATLSCPDAIARALMEYGSLTIEQVVKIIMESDSDIKPLDGEVSVDEEKKAMEDIEKLKAARGKQDYEHHIY